MYGMLETYQPPQWTVALNYIPKKRIRLAMANTPIHPWKLPNAPADFSISVKREDLTGCSLSGNKVRKLEFFMADAVDQGCRHVITWGFLQSNHCRAVALCARQLGLTPHLFVCTDVTDGQKIGCEGNVLLYRLCGAHIYLVPENNSLDLHMEPRMQRLAQHILSSSGESSYLIPVGVSSKTGLFGYFTVFEELRHQGVLTDFDDLVFACCTGEFAAGLAIANHLTGAHLRQLDDNLQALGLGHLRSQDLLRIVDGYKGQGYTLSTKEELQFIQQVARETSLVLDPVYSGKAASGMLAEMFHNPSAFKGRRILFIHTGGIFGLFDGRLTPILEEKEETQPSIKMWPDLDDTPF